MDKKSSHEIEINTANLFRQLVSQWKAILVIAILMTFVCGGLKYIKDIKVYDNNKNVAAEIARISSLPEDEQIEEILLPFSDKEKEMLIHVVNLQDWITMQTEKLAQSVIMKTDPTSQRTLILAYSIESDKENIGEKLFKDYSMYIYDDAVIEQIKQFYGDDIENKYISELINYPYVDESSTIKPSDNILTINVILLEDTDADGVEKTITDMLMNHTPELQASIGEHSLSLIGSETLYIQNQYAIDARNEMFESIGSLKVLLETEKTKLNSSQQAALASINEIKAANNTVGETDVVAREEVVEIPAPGIDIKYAIMGFVLGIILYALIYTVVLVLKGCLNSCADAERVSGARLLGEIYYPNQEKGIRSLLHSRFFDKQFYKEKIDLKSQMEKAVSAIEAIYKHSGVNKLTVISMTDKSSDIIKAIKEKGININHVDAGDELDENNLITGEAGVFVVGDKTKAAKLAKVANTCTDYGIDMLGSVYIREL